MIRMFKIVCFLVLCLSFQGIAQNERHPALDKKISLKAEKQELKKVLDEISSKTGLYFSYDPTVFNVKKIVSVDYKNQKTEEIIKDLLRGEYVFKILQNQVIITKLVSKLTGKGINAVKNEYLKISGRVKNQDDKKPIPYASISIFGKAIGTITNREGNFELKLQSKHKSDTLIISCLGYTQQFIELDTLRTFKLNLELKPLEIRLKEIQITVVDPYEVVNKMIDNVRHNYPDESFLMTAFYREVLLQDEKYINVSEAVLNILKSSYESTFREDRIRFLKGRKSKEVSPFKWVDFKMQGGPYYTTRLDIIKNMDSFLDQEYRNLYQYETEQIIEYLGRPAYVIRFQPLGKMDFLSYEGHLFIEKDTYALLHADFELSREGKKIARRSLIRKKPKQFHVRPIDLKYQVNYKRTDGKWHLNTAKTSVKFRVRSRRDKINSVFHSVSDLLITDHEKTELRRFDREESLRSIDIFTELITDYDPEFWGQFNIIQPNEDLRKALQGINIKNKVDLAPFLMPGEDRAKDDDSEKENWQSNKEKIKKKKKAF